MATKTSTNEISGLAALEPKTDPQIMALASDTGSTSTDILANMQKRAAELTSPWHAFRTHLDDMIARTHYDPTQAIASMDQRKANEAAELQNIGTTKAQVDLLRNQIGSMNQTYGQLSGQSPPQASGQLSNLLNSNLPTAAIASNMGVKLTPSELQVADLYRQKLDVSGFIAFLKERSNILTKASAEAQNQQDLEKLKTEEEWKKPGASETTTQVETLLYNGKPFQGPVVISKLERKLWKDHGIFPQSLTDAGYAPLPKQVQKKATGGLITGIPHMADGASVTLEGANYQPQLDTQQAYTDPMGNIANDNQSQAQFNPNLLENALAGLTGSGSAQAQPSMDPASYGRAQQGGIEAGLEDQKSRNKERNAELEEIAKTEAKKKAEYQGSPEKAENTYRVLKQLKDNSIGYSHLFNLKGTGLAGPILSAILPDVDSSKASPGNAKSKNDLIAQYTLFNRPEDAAKYSLISSGATIAGTEFAKNLAQEGNSRLTNMDIGVGSQAKGVGPDMPYAAHMENLARNMEEARIMYHRGNAFTEWYKKNPRTPVNDFQNSPEYKEASKKAREEIVNEFKDVPESHKYLEIHKDTNGKKYYVYEGKAKYIKD